MQNWDDYRFFLAIARHGALARAGEALMVNPTTVGRRLSALEEALGTRLFDRTPDGYLLTETGRDLVPSAERIEAEMMVLERGLAGADQRIEGVVRVSSTELIATRFIAPRLHKFHADHPGLSLEIECTNRMVSLARREADIAVRLARPTEDNLVIKKLTEAKLELFVGTRYAESRGVPTSDLGGHDVLMFSDGPEFRLENDWLRPRLEGANVVLRADSLSTLYAATVANAGVGLLPRAVASRDPRLVHAPTDTAPPARVVWQAVHRDLRNSARIKKVMAFLSEVFAPVPAAKDNRRGRGNKSDGNSNDRHQNTQKRVRSRA